MGNERGDLGVARGGSMRWTVLLLGSVVGCTASHSAPAISEADFLAEAAVLACERELRCEPYGGASAGRCHPEAYGGADYGIGGCPSSFNGFAAVRCLQGMAEDGCSRDARRVTDEACRAVFANPPPPGSSCDRWSCGEGEVCSAAPGCMDFDCAWSCQRLRGPGEPCTSMTRSSGTLAALATFGGPMAPECAEGLDCVPVSAAMVWPLACAAPTSIGDACGSTGCSPGQACVGEVCARVDRVGDRCTSECGEGLRCAMSDDRSWRCAPRIAEGEACVDGCAGYPLCSASACDEGLRCVTEGEGADGRCLAVVGAGEACGDTSVCPRAYHCDGAACVPDPVEGEACSDDVGCARGACRDGTCVLLEGGEACELRLLETSSDLGECEGRCWDGACVPLVAEGEACTWGLGAPTSVCERGALCDPTELRCVPAVEACRG